MAGSSGPSKKASKRFGGASFNVKGWPTPINVLASAKVKAKAGSVDPRDLGLDPNLDLARAAADFYLLADLAVEDDSADRDMRALADWLARQLARYIEVACLGEARYSFGRVRNLDELISGHGRQFGAFVSHLRAVVSGDRRQVWASYDAMAARFGRQTLLFVVILFDKGQWGGGAMGGPKWATCAKTALAYRRGRLSPVMFVDTAFGLYHNGNIVYDKLWAVGGLKKVLDINLGANLAGLLAFATADVGQRWLEVNR